VSNFDREIKIRFKLDDNILKKLGNLDFDTFEELDQYFFTKETFKNLGTYYASEFNEVFTELIKQQCSPVLEIFNSLFPLKRAVKKTRKVTTFNGCEIFLDDVEGLVRFIEIEGPREKILEYAKV